MIPALGDAILAVAVYGIIASRGTILFKRTAQQSSGMVRLVYGLRGALIGICFGAFVIWLVLIGIRSVGSIADAQVKARPKSANSSGLSARSRLPDEGPPDSAFDADSLMT